MKFPRRDFLHLAVGAAALIGRPHFAWAQTYPAHPITMIVPFAAGGGTDTVARILAERMRGSLGQPIVIENVAGAAGSIGVGRAVRAPADGYTVSVGTVTTHVMIGALYTLSFDLVKDFEPVAHHASEPLLVVGKKDLAANDLKELIAWLKANPGKASAGIAGVGANGHIAGISFQKETGTRFQFVPYRGNGPAMQDLVAGQIDLMIEPSSNFLSHVRAGVLKAYAVASRTRVAAAPTIPTVDEAGLPGFYASFWQGFWTPKGTPKSVIAKLNSAVVESLADASVRARLAELGVESPPPEQQTPEALAALQKAEIEKWWPIVKAANIKGE
jgi:tripartite-type tricarboxylate transporter receptor subunit TctC